MLDVSKAYDSVWRVGLWCKMRHDGVEEKCEGLFSGVETRVVMSKGCDERSEVKMVWC